jgi:hypothetical protein
MTPDTLITTGLKEVFVGQIRRSTHTIDLGNDTIACGSLVLQAPGTWAFYSWNNGASAEPSFHVNATGRYFLSVSDSNYCWRDDSIYVQIRQIPNVNIGNDTLINYWDSLMISTGAGYDSYQWSTGDTTPSIRIKGEIMGVGSHPVWVIVSKDGCENVDTIVITVRNNQGLSGLDPDNLFFRIFPNPTSGNATIEYVLSAASFVHLTILDPLGRSVVALVNGDQQKGKYGLVLNTSILAPGIYYCRLNVNGKQVTRKLIFENQERD